MVDVQVGRVVDHGGSQVGHVVDVWQISVVDHSPTHRRVTATLLCGMGEEQLTQVGWRPGQPDIVVATLRGAGGWNCMIFEVSSKLSHSVIKELRVKACTLWEVPDTSSNGSTWPNRSCSLQCWQGPSLSGLSCSWVPCIWAGSLGSLSARLRSLIL